MKLKLKLKLIAITVGLLLSGLFLKLGSYGVLRFITPNFSGVIAEWGSIFISLGIFSMLYGAFVVTNNEDRGVGAGGNVVEASVP